jgi:Fe-S-cluster-containing dehydrogenase component/CRP-like cAMP-binding protein
VPRNATIKAPQDAAAKVLEVQRPALRLLRKIPKFSEALDRTYRSHGKKALLEDLRVAAGLSQEAVDQLAGICQLRVFSKNHVMLREGAPVDRLHIIKSGWIKRNSERGGEEDFLGEGFCMGLEGLGSDLKWPYTVTLLGRTEVLEIPISKLRQDHGLGGALANGLGRFVAPSTVGEGVKPEVRREVLSAQERLISTGLVDGNNLLVMDMDLCVRCGNCSLACHKIHGQSRLTRRGIHVTRLEAPRPSAIQNVLSPAVCMHCKDPECLTGCPTGAIGRFGTGHIDIDPKTCIGCGDCASQCPYNAISLISRKGSPASSNGGFAHRLRDFFRLRPDPLPAPVEQTDDLLAVKCNLCHNTGLNPAGASRPAYGCEESCPTGALARINPRTYFSEIGQIEGLAFLDQTHAIGRNIHKSDPPRRLIHLLGIALTLAVTGAVVYGLLSYGMGTAIAGPLNMRWITGMIGLVGIIGVMTYPVRRQIYKRRAGALRYWMLAHSYLGVMAGVVLLLHGGTDSGGLLTTLLMISFDLVILTGLVGILFYVMLPRMMTKIEGEPLLVDDLAERRSELQQEIAEIASSPSAPLSSLVRGKVVPHFVSFGYLLRQYLRREKLDDALFSAREKFSAAAAALADEKDRRKLTRAVEAAATLRRVDALIYLHRALKLWLVPHVFFTSLMLALLVVHIIQVIYFA